jgi:serine phosphatase RsbU (regulator of sigma subunit)
VLVVVGDVSGKGLKAAMTVSALHDYSSSRRPTFWHTSTGCFMDE